MSKKAGLNDEVIEISSSSTYGDGDDYEDSDDDEEEVRGPRVDVSPYSVVVKTEEEKMIDDDDCCILDYDPFEAVAVDLEKKLALVSNGDPKDKDDDDDDVAVLAEKGEMMICSPTFENQLQHASDASQKPKTKGRLLSGGNSGRGEKKLPVKRPKGEGKSSLSLPKIRTRNYIRQYCEFMDLIRPRLPIETIELLEDTPFCYYLEFTPIAQDRPIIEMLISSYDQKCDKFKIGDEYHTFDVAWVAQHTWLPSRKKEGKIFD